ncbi:MAG: hypothetical protein DDT19_00005 [Syntrophomonadaceae bacterium]|nr:hypothetical protein [Bacillota bacterium]
MRYKIRDIVDVIDIPTATVTAIKGNTAFYRLHNGQIVMINLISPHLASGTPGSAWVHYPCYLHEEHEP